MAKHVKDEEIENVGIMSGFMDDIEELMEEITEAEMNGKAGEDMAMIMNRQPDSPEILMNNLRGDYRSVDARREELADLVGMKAAVETPDDVLALLQPVLAQQGIESLTPSSVPLQMAGTGGVGEIGVPPTAPLGMPMPPDGSGGIGSLPMGMAEGGIVQNFQEGSVGPSASNPGGVTPAVSPADKYIVDILAQKPSALPDLMSRTRALTPEYEELLGTTDRDAIKAQMLFDIGRAALGFAGNVDPQGQRLRGSAAARLAQATSALPGQIGARVAELRKGEQAARLAALQAAQAERDATIAANLALSERQTDIATELAGRETFRTLGSEEKQEIAKNNPSFDPDLPWQENTLTKELVIAGGRAEPPAFQDPYVAEGRKAKFTEDTELANAASKAPENIAKLDEALRIIETGDINTGILSGVTSNFNRLKAQFLNDPEAASITAQNQYLDSLLGSDVFTAIGALGIGARGLDTPAERDFLIQVMTGSRELDAEALKALTNFRKIREIKMMQRYNDAVDSGRLDDYFAVGYPRKKFEIPEMPVIELSTVAQVRSEEDIAAAVEAERKRQEQ